MSEICLGRATRANLSFCRHSICVGQRHCARQVLIRGNNSELQEAPATRLPPGAHAVDGLVAGGEEDSLNRNLALAEDVLASLAVY